jgi:predicted RNase H-like nuclease (RuvC/YqgF family)
VADETQGQAPSDAGAQPQDGGGEKFDAKYVEELRQEAAKYRTQLRDTQTQLKELQPKAQQFDQLQEAQKTAEQKLQERLAALEADLAAKAVEAERAQKQAQVVRLAAKAGVDADLVDLLDLGKLDLSDEKKALEVLGRFARTAAGAQVKPGGESGGETEAELRKRFFGGQSKTMIFGG